MPLFCAAAIMAPERMPRQISMLLFAAQPEQNTENREKPLLVITTHL
jgi:hypothetical protein